MIALFLELKNRSKRNLGNRNMILIALEAKN